ncbi:hypothetical protein D3C73_1465740 [compost metagenome]
MIMSASVHNMVSMLVLIMLMMILVSYMLMLLMLIMLVMLVFVGFVVLFFMLMFRRTTGMIALIMFMIVIHDLAPSHFYLFLSI